MPHFDYTGGSAVTATTGNAVAFYRKEGNPPLEVKCDGPDCGNCKAREADQDWFRDHPGASEYFRPAFAGELHDIPGVIGIKVMQVRPGTRVKVLVTRAMS